MASHNNNDPPPIAATPTATATAAPISLEEEPEMEGRYTQSQVFNPNSSNLGNPNPNMLQQGGSPTFPPFQQQPQNIAPMDFYPPNPNANIQQIPVQNPLFRRILAPNQILGIIGGGTMAEAIAFPLFDRGLLPPTSVVVSATSEATLDHWRSYGCRITLRNDTVIREASIIIWAVKPQVFAGVVDGIGKDLVGKSVKEGSLHLSIMAGIPLERFVDKIKKGFVTGGGAKGGSGVASGYNFRAIRVMPNVGLKVCQGVTVFAAAPSANETDRELMFAMFEPLGLIYEVLETQINAYCGLFGSGIGFMFPIIEALSDAAVKQGLPRATSLEIAAQVMKGAGALYLKDKTHPGALKDMVCSPGGTTIAGVAELEKGGIRAVIMSAVEAATLRGEEIAAASHQRPAANS